jgi:methylamine dehydrogenase heavy chain
MMSMPPFLAKLLEWITRAFATAVLTASPIVGLAAPPLPTEAAGVTQLSWPPSQHWVWVNDIAFFNMPDGRATLVDGDTGKMLGMLSTGFGFNGLVIAKHGGLIYSLESYYSRGTRGVRTDIVVLYDPRRLVPVAEIGIPPERAAIVPMRSEAALTDDGRFLLVYDFTPAQSVTVVDTRSRKFVGEIGTAGCGLIYPTGARTFFSICADGALLSVTLDDAGHAARLARTPRLFDPEKDPIAEEAVRSGNTWWFTSFQGWVYPIRSTSHEIRLGERWSLFTPAERAQHWRTGGLQYLALYRRAGELYAIVHKGDLATHKDPGKAVWIYDLASRTRVRQIALLQEASSILLSQDAAPLLFTCSFGSNALQVYDARTGRYLRTASGIAETPTIMVSP